MNMLAVTITPEASHSHHQKQQLNFLQMKSLMSSVHYTCTRNTSYCLLLPFFLSVSATAVAPTEIGFHFLGWRGSTDVLKTWVEDQTKSTELFIPAVPE